MTMPFLNILMPLRMSVFIVISKQKKIGMHITEMHEWNWHRGEHAL
jgi:hypothetical protein